MTNHSSSISQHFIDNLPGTAYRSLNDKLCTMLEISNGVERLTGYTKEEFLNGTINLNSIVHPEDKPRSWEQIQTDLYNSGIVDMEYRIIHKSGAVRYVWEHGEAQIVDGEVVEIIGFISDLTPKAKQQEKLKKAQQGVLQLASSLSLARGDLDEFLRTLTVEAANTLEVDRVSVWLFDKKHQQLTLSCLYEKNKHSFTTEVILLKKDYPRYFEAVINSRILEFSDIRLDPRTQEFVAEYMPATGVRAMLDVSIRLSGEVIGVICNEVIGNARRWDLEDIAHASELADLTAQLLSNKKRIEIENQIRETNAASKAKSQLLAMISHEIRTPMNGVLGMAELLNATTLTVAQQEYLDTIRDSGDLLLTIINDFLDYSKIDAGKLKLVEGDTTIGILLQGVVSLLTPMAKENVSLYIKKMNDFPESILIDHYRLRQILINIIGNALKFTEHGSVTIEYGLVDEKNWYLNIADTGPGVKQDQLKKLFLPFEQILQKNSSTSQEGTGLGLSICKAIVKIMNGQIDAKSTINIGTTIRIDLPLKSSQSFKKDTDNKLTSAKKNQFKHLNILVAEDNAVNRSVIKGLLTNLQITPDICNDGKEALDKFKSNKGKYDLILMDCDMPVMNGFNASRQIRSLNCAHPNLAIAAVTAHALNEFRQKASDCGMNYYLTKPIRLNDLTELLVKVSSPN